MNTNLMRVTGLNIILGNDCDIRDTLNEINATKLAENIAWELECDEWLDDESHVVWEVALKLAEESNKSN